MEASGFAGGDSLLQEYNPRCIPSWNMADPADAKDFTRKVKEARKVPPRDKQPGWLLLDPAYAPDDVPDRYHAVIGKYIAQVKARLHKPAADDETVKVEESKNTERELRFLCQPTGLLGELCSWINSTTLQPQPFLTLACSLTFLGTLFGRKISDYMDSRTNLYCMGVIISSGGKNHAPKKIRQLCEKAGCEDLLGGDDIASDSAIERTLAEHPSTLYLWDEIGHMLYSMKHNSIGHKAGVVALLMKLYSSSGNNYKGKDYASQESRRIVQPCCCVYGTTSPHRFIEGITREEIEDGWLGRCLVFQAGEKRPDKERNRTKVPPPQNLVDKVTAWHSRNNLPESPTSKDLIQRIGAHKYEHAAPKQTEISIDDDAEKILRDFHDIEAKKQGKENPEVDYLWAKAEENARKIALIVAASENYEAPRITRSVADYSVRLIRYLLNDFAVKIVPQIASNKIEKEKLKIIEVLKKSGPLGLTKSDLTRKTQWTEKIHRDSLLDDLIESGMIVVRSMPNKKGVKYWTAENYKKLQADSKPLIGHNESKQIAHAKILDSNLQTIV